MRRWKRDPALARVRDPAALEKIGERERAEIWRQVWDAVDALIRRVGD